MANEYIAGGKGALVEKQYAFDRSFDVIIVKQIPVSRTDLSAAVDQFNSKYAEFLTTVRGALDFVAKRKDINLQPLITSTNSTGFFPIIPFGADATNQLYGNAHYIDIIALGIIDLTRPAWLIRVRSSKVDGIEDILSASVRLSVSGVGQASFVVKNDLDKYCFQRNALLAGKTIFEPDDIVVVRLPDRDANLNTNFTGYVNAVERSRSPGQNTVTIECEDIMKRLRYSRVAIQKSLLDRDPQAHFVPLSAFTFPWVQGDGGEADAVQKIVTNVGAYSLSTINNIPTVLSLINQYNDLYKQRNFFSTEPKPTTGLGTIGIDTNAISAEISTLRAKIETTRSSFVDFYIDTSNSVGMKTSGIKVFKNTVELVGSQSTNFTKKPVMIIDGTSQPAYDVAFRNGFDLWISEWKETYRLFNEFANIVNFEFFANEEGIIRFRPVNTSLQHLLDSKNVHIIHDYNVYRENTYENNSEIANVAIATGNWKIRLGTSLDSLGIFGYIKDNRLIQKYGEKMTSLQPVIGLVTNSSLNVWASSVLNRINRKAFAGGTLEVVGDSRYQVGNYIYLESSNMLFYIDSIEHNVSPGGSYRTRMNLTYRRMPAYDIAQLFASQVGTAVGTLFRTTDDSKRELARQFLDKDVLQNGTFTRVLPASIAIAYSLLSTNLKQDGYSQDEINHIYNPKNSLSSTTVAKNLALFYCAGYLWEFGVDIDFAQAQSVDITYRSGLDAANAKNQNLQNAKNQGLLTGANFDKMGALTGQP